MTQVVKTTLIEGVGWPEVGKIPPRFRHDYVKRIRTFKPMKPRVRKKKEDRTQEVDNQFFESLNEG